MSVRLHPRTARAVIAAWHGPDARATVAKRYRLSPTTVSRVWQHARAMGRLPAGPRPAFAANSYTNAGRPRGLKTTPRLNAAAPAASGLVDDPGGVAAFDADFDSDLDRLFGSDCGVRPAPRLPPALAAALREGFARGAVAVCDARCSHTPAQVAAEARRADAAFSARVAPAPFAPKEDKPCSTA